MKLPFKMDSPSQISLILSISSFDICFLVLYSCEFHWFLTTFSFNAITFKYKIYHLKCTFSKLKMPEFHYEIKTRENPVKFSMGNMQIFHSFSGDFNDQIFTMFSRKRHHE